MNTIYPQITIILNENLTIEVDEGLEHIIQHLFKWNIHTSNSCINNNGTIWICFDSYFSYQQFLQLSLRNNILTNGTIYQRETLFNFLQDCDFTNHFDEEVILDPNNEDTVIGTGRLEIEFSLRFDIELFEDFKQLFFEVFP